MQKTLYILPINIVVLDEYTLYIRYFINTTGMTNLMKTACSQRTEEKDSLDPYSHEGTS